MADKLLVQTLSTAILIWVVWRILNRRPREKPVLRSVAILVLGDIGRSPRMMYHAESFAKKDYETFLIGYNGITPTLTIYRIRN